MIDVESYRNYEGQLRVGVRHVEGASYYKVLTRDEAAKLRDDLNAILEAEKETKS